MSNEPAETESRSDAKDASMMSEINAVHDMLEREADAVAAKLSNQLWREAFAVCPGAAIQHIRQLTRCKFRPQDVPHARPMDWFVRYCITPPVYPAWEREETQWAKRQLRPCGQVRARQCIVCGHTHVTSEDCPVPERREHVGRTSMVRRDDGYKMQQARNMGAFDDADNWETRR